jgi:hypothetical protein
VGAVANTLIENHEFVVDLARFAEGSLTERQVKKKWKFDSETWTRLGEDEPLVQAIEDEKIRRVRNGSAARELAQQAFVAAPTVLSGILTDNNANPRHRIESAKELRAIAQPAADTIADRDRFIITINMNGDNIDGNAIEHYDKPRAVGVEDNGVDTLTITATKNKSGSDGDGGRSI